MSALEKAVALFVLVVALAMGGGLLLPASWASEREVVVAAEPLEVLGRVGRLDRWGEWSPYGAGADPTARVSVGAASTTLHFSGTQVGSGEVQLLPSADNANVAYRVVAQEGRYVSTGEIAVEAVSAGSADVKTRVIWREGGALGHNPIKRYFGLGLGAVVGAEQDAALARLAALVEADEGT